MQSTSTSPYVFIGRGVQLVIWNYQFFHVKLPTKNRRTRQATDSANLRSDRGGMPSVPPLPQSPVYLLPHLVPYWTSNFNSCHMLKEVTLPIGTNDFYDLRSIQTSSGTRTAWYARVNLKVVAFCEVTSCTL